VCPGCGRQSDKLEPFLFVSLPISSSQSSPPDRGKIKTRRATFAVYVTVVRQTTHEVAVRHGFQLVSSKRSTVAKLKRLISERTNIPHDQVRHYSLASVGFGRLYHSGLFLEYSRPNTQRLMNKTTMKYCKQKQQRVVVRPENAIACLFARCRCGAPRCCCCCCCCRRSGELTRLP